MSDLNPEMARRREQDQRDNLSQGRQKMTTAEITVLPIADSVDDYAFEVTAQLMNAGLIATTDADSSRTLSTRLREMPDNHYAVIVTQADETNHTIQLRTRSAAPALVLPLQTFIEIATKAVPPAPAAAESPATERAALGVDLDAFERAFLTALLGTMVEICDYGHNSPPVRGMLQSVSCRAYFIEQIPLVHTREGILAAGSRVTVMIERGPAVSIKAAG